MENKKRRYEIGESILCKVVAINKNYFEIQTLDKEKGITYVNEISDYYVNNLKSVVNVGDVLYLKFKSVRQDGTLLLSFKENRSYFLRTPFEFELNESNEEKTKFQNLFKFTNEEIKKWKK